MSSSALPTTCSSSSPSLDDCVGLACLAFFSSTRRLLRKKSGEEGGFLPTGLKNALLPLQFSLDKFEIGNVFNGNMSHHEQ